MEATKPRPLHSVGMTSLPLENRQQIYKHTFDSAPAVPFLVIDKKTRLNDATNQYYHITAAKQIEPIMAQIPQLRAEVLEEYYKHATFAVSIRPRRTCSYLPHQSDSIGHCNVPKIRHLELRYGSLLVIGITMSNQVERIRLDRDDEDAVCSETGSRHILTMKKAKDFAKVLRRNEDQVELLWPLVGAAVSRFLESALTARTDGFLSSDDIIMLVSKVDEADRVVKELFRQH